MQGFAKGLLDVADNLGRAAEAVPQNFRQPGGEVDLKKAAQLLISLLQGVEMTERQLQQVQINYLLNTLLWSTKGGFKLGSRTKETPIFSAPIGREQKYGPQEFTVGSGFKFKV